MEIPHIRYVKGYTARFITGGIKVIQLILMDLLFQADFFQEFGEFVDVEIWLCSGRRAVFAPAVYAKSEAFIRKTLVGIILPFGIDSWDVSHVSFLY